MRGSIKKRGSTYTYVVDIGPAGVTIVGIGVSSRIKSLHLIVPRSKLRVTLGCGGSAVGAGNPPKGYSSANLKALCPIS